MKVGIVGHGSIGKRHAENFRNRGHKVTVYDPQGPKDYKFERELYDDVDAVVIATPSWVHEAGLRAAIERRKHVLIEKPISTSVGHLRELLKIADENNLVVMMGNNLRFHPCVLQAQTWLTTETGSPIWANFICATEGSITNVTDGVTLNTGAHEVDLALQMFGPGEVTDAAPSRLVGRNDVAMNFVIEHNESNVRSSFLLNWETPNRIREFWIACWQHNIGVDLDKRLCSLGGSGRQMPGSYDSDYIDEINAFERRIEGEIVPGATGHDGLATLKILLDVRRKAGLL